MYGPYGVWACCVCGDAVKVVCHGKALQNMGINSSGSQVRITCIRLNNVAYLNYSSVFASKISESDFCVGTLKILSIDC